MSTTEMVGLSQQMALRRTMDVIANNLANMNTTAYKSEAVLFDEYLMDVGTDSGKSQSVSFVIDSGTSRDLAVGPMNTTNAPLDLALSDRGYFVIETAAGERYTRNGHFKLNEDGQLSTHSGNAVLDTDGRAINISPEEGPINISRNGTVSTALGAKGTIAVVRFDNETAMEKEGESLYGTDEAPIPVEMPEIVQGAIETSNVSSILEMTKMIDVMRSYQSAANLMKTEEDLSREAIRQLGTVA